MVFFTGVSENPNFNMCIIPQNIPRSKRNLEKKVGSTFPDIVAHKQIETCVIKQSS